MTGITSVPGPMSHSHKQKPGALYQHTCPGWMVPGHHAMVGSRMPPSNVVSLPHSNTPFEPPAKQPNITGYTFSNNLAIHLPLTILLCICRCSIVRGEDDEGVVSNL